MRHSRPPHTVTHQHTHTQHTDNIHNYYAYVMVVNKLDSLISITAILFIQLTDFNTKVMQNYGESQARQTRQNLEGGGGGCRGVARI